MVAVTTGSVVVVCTGTVVVDSCDGCSEEGGFEWKKNLNDIAISTKRTKMPAMVQIGFVSMTSIISDPALSDTL